jgi:hypothetical protein
MLDTSILYVVGSQSILDVITAWGREVISTLVGGLTFKIRKPIFEGKKFLITVHQDPFANHLVTKRDLSLLSAP